MFFPKSSRLRHLGRKSLLSSVIFTIVLLGSIALAIRDANPVIAIWVLVAVAILVALFHLAFTGSDFFSIVFANALGVYACIYIILVSANFPDTTDWVQQIGFVMPLFSFVAGVLVRRKQIQALMTGAARYGDLPFHGTALWLGPFVIVAGITTFLRIAGRAADSQNATLIAAMGAVSAVAWMGSRNIALFLIEVGLVFKSFLANARKLVRPACALLTCYSLIIIFFGSIYTTFDQFSPAPNFSTVGAARHITFPEGLYLSVATLTTVGFGDIAATSPTARLLVSVEILVGVVLLLFGVEAMLERRHHTPRSPDESSGQVDNNQRSL